jgi:hypothetical protein
MIYLLAVDTPVVIGWNNWDGLMLGDVPILFDANPPVFLSYVVLPWKARQPH